MLDSDDDEEEDDDLPAFDMSHDVKVVRGKDAPTLRYLRDVLDHLGEVGVVEHLAEFIDPVWELYSGVYVGYESCPTLTPL
jgi:hypothetical protein